MLRLRILCLSALLGVLAVSGQDTRPTCVIVDGKQVCGKLEPEQAETCVTLADGTKVCGSAPVLKSKRDNGAPHIAARNGNLVLKGDVVETTNDFVLT
jgi:hypothetical protein